MSKKLTVYCYPKCSTCKKALDYLNEKGITYDLHDIKTQNPTAEQLREWHTMSKLPLKKFFNTSGMIYKEQGLKEKLPSMSQEEQYALLGTDGMLVKRPLVIGADFVLTGFRKAEWDAKFDR
ncbi:MAG: arsenate reductase family protein [Lachnospiraceae bacterium]|nr:arsenate reductase family protein [Lachnospiraceae bacterium]